MATRKKVVEFNTNDFVVYPNHGLGRILGTEQQEFSGTAIDVVVIRFERDRLTLRVPLEKARTLGLRTLSSKKQMDDAIATLKGSPRKRREMWAKRAKVYDEKIRSGKLVSIAEVVRDLHRKENKAEQSYSERQMYQAALDRLAREIAAIEQIPLSVAISKLEDLMTAD